MILGSALTIAVAGLVAMSRSTKEPLERGVSAPVSVQRSFQAFADSTGKQLLDTLFALGFHGGYAWDEKRGAVRPNLIVRTELQSVKDSAANVYEGTMTLDFHHDSLSKLPPSASLRFGSTGDAAQWILLTTDGFLIDPSRDLRLEFISRMPGELHAALRSVFAGRAEAYDYWNNLEPAQRSQPAAPPAS